MNLSKNTKPRLRLDWCSHKAAKYACEHWHYTGSVPGGKHIFVGVWENDVFIGCIIFGCGANNFIGSPYGLTQDMVCELVRVALTNHASPVTRIISIALKFLVKRSPKLLLCVSYADQAQGHHGGIYQGGNWIYVGQTKTECQIKIKGKVLHRKTVFSRYGRQDLAWIQKTIDPKAERIVNPPKHKYLYPLTSEMRDKIAPLAKPYPKRAHDKGNRPDQG
jgi:hypothetical protein